MLICSQEEKILYTHTYTQPSKCRLHLNISKEFLSLWLFVEWEKKIQFHSHYNIKDHHHHIFNSNHLLNWKNCFPFLVSCFIVWSGKKWQNNTSNNFQKKEEEYSWPLSSLCLFFCLLILLAENCKLTCCCRRCRC